MSQKRRSSCIGASSVGAGGAAGVGLAARRGFLAAASAGLGASFTVATFRPGGGGVGLGASGLGASALGASALGGVGLGGVAFGAGVVVGLGSAALAAVESAGWDEWVGAKQTAQVEAVLLLVAIIAGIALTLRRRKGNRAIDPSLQIKVKKADRLRLVPMRATVELPAASRSEGNQA